MTIVRGDSHTSTHGAFGALAFHRHDRGRPSTRAARKPRRFAINVTGKLRPGVTAKDDPAHHRHDGVNGATGYVFNRGATIEACDGRALTVCNMSIEAVRRRLRTRRHSPSGKDRHARKGVDVLRARSRTPMRASIAK
jgi:3-isopropylmalate/(R)-2-methylmalate dehydratase large subunit